MFQSYYGFNFESVEKDETLNDFSKCEDFYKKFVKKINTVKVCDGSSSGCTYDGFNSAGGGCEFGSGARSICDNRRYAVYTLPEHISDFSC